MRNPIPKGTNLFVTPHNFLDLSNMLNNIGTPDEKRMAWYGAMIALNLAYKLVEEQKEVA
jgi:hypothetical protein